MGLLRAGISPVGSTLFCTHACCKHCAIDIVDAGISKVYYRHEYRCSEGLQYLQQNGVAVEKLSILYGYSETWLKPGDTCGIATNRRLGMNKKQLDELFKWLDHQVYSGEPGTDGEYLRMEEMRQYLPGAIKAIMEKEQESN
jgi:hypothetical protein